MREARRKSGAAARLARTAQGLAYSLSRALPSRGAAPVLRYYELFHELFDIVSESTGIFNIGYAEDPERADLARAQEGMVRLVIDSLPEKGRLLDVGCGVGGPACLAAEEKAGAELTGINITGIHLAEAKRRAREKGLSRRVRFCKGDAQAIPFAGGSFDGLYAIETAFHYPDKALFAREAHRVLKPGGALSVADIVWDRPPEGLRGRLLSAAWKQAMSSPEIFSADQWAQSLAAAGFSRVEVRDISRGSLGLLPLWLERLEAHRAELSRRYPAALMRAVLAGFRLTLRWPGLSPIAYIHVTARK